MAQVYMGGGVMAHLLFLAQLAPLLGQNALHGFFGRLLGLRARKCVQHVSMFTRECLLLVPRFTALVYVFAYGCAVFTSTY